MHAWAKPPIRGITRYLAPRRSACRLARIGLTFAVLVILPLLFCPSLPAQSDTATLSGRITDESGAVIVGVEVLVTNGDSGTETTTLTNESGVYVLSELRPGSYQITLEKSGFRKVVLTGLTLNVQGALSRNFTMQVGPVNETVLVVAGTEEMEVSPAVSTVVDQRFVQNMPLNGRSFQSLLGLSPGYIIVTPTDAFGGPRPGQFAVNGQRANANYFMVDGVSANFAVFNGYDLGQTGGGTIPGFNIQGGTNGLVSVDAMREFRGIHQ